MSNAALSLLIIDDNEGSLELLSSALAQPGLEILTHPTPNGGWTWFSKSIHKSFSPTL
jgi:hypothetical protein